MGPNSTDIRTCPQCEGYMKRVGDYFVCPSCGYKARETDVDQEITSGTRDQSSSD